MKDYNDLCKVRLGPIRPVLFTADLKLLELLLTSSRNIEKSLDYRFLYKWLGTGLLTGGGIYNNVATVMYIIILFLFKVPNGGNIES